MQSPFIKSLSLACLVTALFNPLSCAASEQLVFAIDVVRHGDRTPYDDLPAAPHHWQEGEGQLTALGMQHEYELGLKLHQRYRIDHALLSTHYQPGEVYVRSTDYDRTLMSAQSLLLGLYPLGSGPASLPSGFQPIPIHTVPASQDSAYLIDIGSKEIGAVINKYVYNSTEWKTKSTELETQFPNWRAATGVQIGNMFDVLNLSDTVRAYVNHGVALPPALTQAEADKIMKAGDWIYAAIFKPREVGEVAGKPALKKILAFLKAAAEGKPQSKLVIISAHDVTTLGILSALHAPLESAPTYAADLNFSLYRADGSNYYVKVTYNDKPVMVPGCHGNICSLSSFMKMA